ncbi:MAG: paraslipin [Leptospiraceae bacterium]|jgi:regulator of protease activity HflC (stomatin/prohibitin superfamily)|nr:paraslipin [Leptospiraceae bacterium]
MSDTIAIIVYTIIFIYIAYKFIISVRIVPAQEVLIVERLGKYHKTLGAGFHLLIPFLDKVVYNVSLKEEAIDVPSQICITRDNVQVKVDGIIYMKVIDPYKAVYHINDYKYALIQLAQTTMRSVFGDLDLDKTFEERESLNAKIVGVVDEAADHWGVKIMRYEIQNITPPERVLQSMEKQMTAEREKRALIAKSEGDKLSRINRSEGQKQEMINESEGEKQRLINEAEGEVQEILQVAQATAEGIRQIANAIRKNGGEHAVMMKIANEYLVKLKRLANKETEILLPMDFTNLEEVLKGLENFVNKK